ncbi:MAG TPA: P-II family nitrogen regulator [Candidatus Onthovivens sp.]|nr:P-II family nitrogen regulator [Candidatus Onthovivens sp.]
MTKFELIVVFVNSGFSENIMEAAREEGVNGGTILHARGTGSKLMQEKYGIVITPDKEMILILVKAKIKDRVLQAINKAGGLATDGAGIAFSLPVNDVVGLKFDAE